MKKYLTIEKSTGKVVSYSDGLNVVDEEKFEQKEVELTPEQFEKIDGPNATFFKDKNFDFTPIRTAVIDKEAVKQKLSDKNVSIDEKINEISKIIDLL